ncbi:MAG: NADH:flavin oxidoreductase [Gammaproteobacteria bacterium]
MSDLSKKGVKKYPYIFTPLVINKIVIPNRIYFSPFGIDDANIDGTISDSLENFYRNIAKGGCGLIMLSNCSVSPDSILNPRGLKMHNNIHSNRLKRIINRVECYGGILGIQLQHYGAQAVTTFTNQALLSPSGFACKHYGKKDSQYKVREMTLDDIEEVKQQFIDAAVLSASAGVKFIQLQAANGYLLHSFMSPYTNKRTDGYGGNYENRARLLIEIIRGIKLKLKDNIILSATIGINDCLDQEGVRPSDYKFIMPLLESSGIDSITVSISIAETFKNLIIRTHESEKKLHSSIFDIKKHMLSSIPIGFSGFTNSLQSAEDLIKKGTSNFIGMGRSLFADNDLILKSIDGNNNSIFQCLWDGNCFKDKSNSLLDRVYCCVNPKYKRPNSIKYN